MAKLKAKYDKKEDVPAQYIDLFEEKDEKWVLVRIDGLITDGSVTRLEASIKKERDENAKLREDAQLYGKTPDEVHALMEELEATKAQLATGNKPNEEQIDKIVEARLATKIGPINRASEKMKKELEASLTENKDLKGQIITTQIEDAVRKAGVTAKVKSTAMSDLLLRARNSFDVVEFEGSKKIVTRDGIGVTPGLDPDGWVEELMPNSPHLFEASVGAGANGSGRGTGFQGNNPWTQKFWNMTEQGRFYKEHGKDKAAQFAESAGSAIGATKPPTK